MHTRSQYAGHEQMDKAGEDVTGGMMHDRDSCAKPLHSRYTSSVTVREGGCQQRHKSKHDKSVKKNAYFTWTSKDAGYTLK